MISYHPADPMILLFSPIRKLKIMASASNIAYTRGQLLDIGITVIRNTQDFERAIRDWEAIPNADKSWHQFKLISRQRRNNCVRFVAQPCSRQATITQTILLDSYVKISKSEITTYCLSSRAQWRRTLRLWRWHHQTSASKHRPLIIRQTTSKATQSNWKC